MGFGRKQRRQTEIEDATGRHVPHCVCIISTRAPAPSTPLHGFIPVTSTTRIPFRHVAASKDQEQLTQDIYGDEVGYARLAAPSLIWVLPWAIWPVANPQTKRADHGPTRPDQLGG